MEITRVGFGAWAIGGGGFEWSWGAQEDEDSVAAIHRALELGVNWIDTAAQYGFGHSEEVVGRAIASPRRAAVHLHQGRTARGARRRDAPRPDARRAQARARRKPRAPRPRRRRPLPDPLADPRRADRGRLGRARRVPGRGARPSHRSLQLLRRAAAPRLRRSRPVETLQPPYSLIARDVEEEILPFAEREDIGVIVYSPMGSGLLTGAMTRERIEALPDDDWRRRARVPRPAALGEPRARRTAAASSPSATARLPARSPSPGRSAIPPSTPRSSASAGRPGRPDRRRGESRAQRRGRRGDRGVSVRARP